MADRFLAVAFLFILAASSGAGQDPAGKKEVPGGKDAASTANGEPVIQKPESKPPSASPKSAWAWSLDLDAYLSRNLNRPASDANQLRVFDVSSDHLRLNYGQLMLEHAASPLGFHLELGSGQAARLFEGKAADDGLAANLMQAYGSFRAPVGRGLTLDFGKFMTSLNAEVLRTRDNYNYSRSLLFSYAIPCYHFGLRASYPLSPTLTVGAQVVNGWNRVRGKDPGKTLVGTATWKPHSRVSLTHSVISGVERPQGQPSRRTVWDSVAVVTATSRLSLQFSHDYGVDRPDGIRRVSWTGLAAAVRYALSPRWAIAPRLEWFNDANGFTTGLPQRVKEGTMTAEFKIRDGLLARWEYRHDRSDRAFFDRGCNTAAARHQNTLLIGLLFAYPWPR